MKKLVLVLVLLMAGLWVYGKISEQASTPRYSNSSPRETIQTFFTAIKERDAEGIRCTFDKEGYGMNAMEEIHSYVTPGIETLQVLQPIQAGGTQTAVSAALLGTDGEIVTTVHCDLKKIDNEWKITGLGTAGGLKKKDLEDLEEAFQED